jgi:hypothetical protein
MNTLHGALALFFATLPILAQTKPLVAKDRVPIKVAGDYPGGIAYPTFCDERGRLYVKLIEQGPEMRGPLLRISDKGIVETRFDTAGELINRYATRPDGGVIMIHTSGSTQFIDNFSPDGKFESSVALESTPIHFFPSVIAVFHSGEILISGSQYRPGYKASTAIFDSTGHLVKQLVLEKDAEVESAISKDTGAQRKNIRAIGTSVAIAGDDGLVYLMRATSPVVVYAISATGEVVHKIVVRVPSEKALPSFGFGVAKNKLTVQFRQSCSGRSDSCWSSVYPVVDVTTGKQPAMYAADKDVTGTMACFLPDPDRFLIFSQNQDGFYIVQAEPK